MREPTDLADVAAILEGNPKAVLFRAVGPHKLDPRSSEIFEYFETGTVLKGSPVLKSDIAAMPAPSRHDPPFKTGTFPDYQRRPRGS